MPSINKPDECPHTIMLKKAITINPLEKTGSLAKGYPLPDYVYVHFCTQCWSVNPKVEAKKPAELTQ